MSTKSYVVALVLFGSGIFGPVVGAEDSPPSGTGMAGQFYENALMRFAQEDYRGAVVQLKNALQQDTRHLPSRILLGRAYLATGYPTQAEMELAQALDMGADRALIDIPLAESYSKLGRFSDLVADIDPGRHAPVDAARLKVLLGRAYLELAQYDMAERSFAEALLLDPQVAGVLTGQALYHLRRGNQDEAKSLLDRATAADSGAAEAWFLKSRIAYQEGNIEEAVANTTRALEADPEYDEARLSRAALLNDLGRLDLAQKDLDLLHARPLVAPMANYIQAIVYFRSGEKLKAEESLAIASNRLSALPAELLTRRPEIRLLAGTVAYIQGNFEVAANHLETYLERNSGHVKARQMMAHIHLSRNQPELAYKKLRPLLIELKDDPTIMMLLGQIHLAMKDDKAAAQVFQELAARRPEDAGLQMNLARSLIGSRQIAGALDALDNAKRLGGRETTAGLMLAVLQLNQGNYEQAIIEAIAVISREPENLLALNILGLARLGAEDLIGSRAAFTRALELDENYLPARLNLGRVDIKEGQPQRARELYQGILDRNPSQRETLIAMAELDESQNRPDLAIRSREKLRGFYPEEIESSLKLVELYLNNQQAQQALEVALALKSQHPEEYQVLIALGITEIAAGKPGNARVTFKNLAHWVSYDAEKLYRIAQYQKQLGDLSSAYWSLIKAVDSMPDWLAATVDLALLEIRMGKMEDALGRALKIQTESPQLAEGYFVEAEMHLAEGNFSEAELAYLRAWELQRDSGTAMRLFQVRQMDGRPEEAFQGLQSWSRERPDDLTVQETLAAEMVRAGRYDDARKRYVQLLLRRPDDPALLNNLAMLYQMAGDSRALEVAEKAYRLSPRDPLIADTLGWILVSEGRAQEGLRYLREAQSRRANLPDIGYHLALALHALNRKAEAQLELEKVIRSGKDFPEKAAAEKLLRELLGEGQDQ